MGWSLDGFFGVCVCAFLAMEGSAVFVFLSFFLDRERGRGWGFFFGPKRILWCEKVGMACADKVDTKRPDLSFLSIHLSPLSCLSPTLYGSSFSGSSTLDYLQQRTHQVTQSPKPILSTPQQKQEVQQMTQTENSFWVRCNAEGKFGSSLSSDPNLWRSDMVGLWPSGTAGSGWWVSVLGWLLENARFRWGTFLLCVTQIRE